MPPRMMPPSDSSGSSSSRCEECQLGECSRHELWNRQFLVKLLLLLGCVIAVYGVVYLDSLTSYQTKKTRFVGLADRQEHIITVSGHGKVTGSNDVAVTSIGFSNIDKDVAVAQANNKRVMDMLIADLRAMGIADKDMQSDYSVNAEYNYYPDKPSDLKGYRMTHTVTVKIRDLQKAPGVLNLAGKYGANQINGLNFMVDDTESLKAEARAKAVAEARSKAESLARSLGVRLVGITNYNEYDNGYAPSPLMLEDKRVMMSAAGNATPPDIATGSSNVEVNVNISYSILP